MSQPRAASLTFLIARDAPVGIVARRGPSKRTCLIRWDIRKGTFETGHWFKGQVGIADLSPGGEWLLASCHTYYGDWLVLSRPPYLTAHALWPRPYGAAFESDTRIRLGWKAEHGGAENEGPFRLPTAMTVRLSEARDDARPPDRFRWHWVPGSRFKPHRHEIASDFANGTAVDGPDGLRLQRNLLNRTRLIDGRGRPLALLPKAAGAVDFNPWGRQPGLAFAIGGKLFGLPTAGLKPLADEEAVMAAATELADFTGMTFEARPAPDWAMPARHLRRPDTNEAKRKDGPPAAATPLKR